VGADPGHVELVADGLEAHPLVEAHGVEAGVAPQVLRVVGSDVLEAFSEHGATGPSALYPGMGRHSAKAKRLTGRVRRFRDSPSLRFRWSLRVDRGDSDDLVSFERGSMKREGVIVVLIDQRRRRLAGAQDQTAKWANCDCLRRVYDQLL
jgi:hypothetical protein